MTVSQAGHSIVHLPTHFCAYPLPPPLSLLGIPGNPFSGKNCKTPTLAWKSRTLLLEPLENDKRLRGLFICARLRGLLVYREEFCRVFIWEISARTTGMNNSRNTTKMVEHKLVSFTTVLALWSLLPLLIKLIHTLQVEIHS